MKQLFLFLSIGSILISCQKESSFKFQNKSVLELFEQKQPPPQQFTVNASAGDLIKGSKGTRIMIPPNAFVTLSGQPVTGNVIIQLKEIYSIADMVLHNKFTQCGFKPLESGGSFYIMASQNNQQLKLAPNVTLMAVLPAQNALRGMQVFNGNLYDSAEMSNFFTWTPNKDPAFNNISVADSFRLENYLVSTNSLEWVNCDHFMTDASYLIKVLVSNAKPDDVIVTMVHFTGMKSVIRLGSNQANNYFMGLVPEKEATLIAASYRDGKLYAAFDPVQLKSDHQYALILEPISEADFEEKLSKLN